MREGDGGFFGAAGFRGDGPHPVPSGAAAPICTKLVPKSDARTDAAHSDGAPEGGETSIGGARGAPRAAAEWKASFWERWRPPGGLFRNGVMQFARQLCGDAI